MKKTAALLLLLSCVGFGLMAYGIYLNPESAFTVGGALIAGLALFGIDVDRTEEERRPRLARRRRSADTTRTLQR